MYIILQFWSFMVDFLKLDESFCSLDEMSCYMLLVNNFIPLCNYLFSHLSYLTNITCMLSSQHLEKINPKIAFLLSVSLWATQQVISRSELKAGHYDLNRKEKY